jgi:hypothetical protein
MTKKKIFIGGSLETYDQAEYVASHFDEVKDLLVEPILWRTVFLTGDITLARIEKLADDIEGAIIIATPDDPTSIRKKRVYQPRANVIFEYSYLLSRLGRSRVALCVYDKTELPSDLKGLTYVEMGEYIANRDITHIARKKLTYWVKNLPVIQEGIPTSSLDHGYSGRWKLAAEFTRWRRRDIADPDQVFYEADMVLYVPFCDKEFNRPGCGSAHGEINISLRSEKKSAVFSRSDQILEAVVGVDGSLKLSGEVKSRQVVSLKHDKSSLEDGFEAVLQITRHFEIDVKPTNRSHILEGTYITSAFNKTISIANVRLSKVLSVRPKIAKGFHSETHETFTRSNPWGPRSRRPLDGYSGSAGQMHPTGDIASGNCAAFAGGDNVRIQKGGAVYMYHGHCGAERSRKAGNPGRKGS